MKIFKKNHFLSVIVIFLFLIHDSNGSKAKEEIEMYSEALRIFIDDYLSLKTRSFEFLVLMDSEKSYDNFACQVISNVLKRKSSFSPAQINLIDISKDLDSIKILKISTIIFMTDESMFNKIFDQLTINSIDFPDVHHLVILQNVHNDCNNFLIYDNTLQSNIQHSSIMLHGRTKERIELMTMQREPRNASTLNESRKNCKGVLKTVNTFSSLSKKWDNGNFGLQKTEDLHGCYFIAEIYTFDETSQQFIFLNNTLSTLQDHLNFKYSTKISKVSKDSSSDTWMSILNVQNSDILHMFPLDQRAVAFLSSTGNPYDEFEKFILPFDSATWILVSISFINGFVVIAVVKCQRIRFQNLVFGKGVRTPNFNMLMAIFGQPQNILPSTNFARYLLMLFILFCLIIRTGYQSLQYEVMLKVS